MFFSNKIFEMHSKLSLPVFILMGTFSYLGAMETDPNTFETHQKSGHISLTETSTGFTDLNNQEEMGFSNQKPKDPPGLLSSRRSVRFGGRFGRGERTLGRPYQQPTTISEINSTSLTSPSEKKSNSSSVTPELSYPEIHDPSLPKDRSPGSVTPLVNPISRLQGQDADEEVFSSDEDNQDNALAVALDFSTETTVGFSQRFDFGTDVSQDLQLVRKERDELLSLVQSKFSRDIDSSIEQEFDLTQINEYFSYAYCCREYTNGDQKQKEEIVESVQDLPGYEGINIKNAEEFLLHKMLDSSKVVRGFSKDVVDSRNKIVGIAKELHVSGQTMTALTLQSLEQCHSVMDKMEESNFALFNSLRNLVYRQDILQMMDGVSSDIVRNKGNSNPRQLVQFVELIVSQFMTSHQLNLTLAQAANTKEENMNMLLKRSEGDSNKIDALTIENNILNETVRALQIENQRLTASELEKDLKIAELEARIASLQKNG